MNVTDASLRSLDVAPPGLTTAEHSRAEAALERILRTPAPGPGGRTQSHRSHPARPTPRRVLGLAAAAAVAAVGTSVIPWPGQDGTAYASWKAVPSVAPIDDLRAVQTACQDQLRGSSLDLRAAEVVLSERRGDFVVLLFRTDDPDMSGSCLARNPPGTDDVSDVESGVGGSSGPALVPPGGGFTQGAFAEFNEPTASITDGAVGAGVEGVTIHAGRFAVQATVANGRYVAWWPGPSFEDGARSDGLAGPELIVTYDLTLTDGTVVRDAQPTRPS